MPPQLVSRVISRPFRDMIRKSFLFKNAPRKASRSGMNTIKKVVKDESVRHADWCSCATCKPAKKIVVSKLSLFIERSRNIFDKTRE